MKRHSTREMLVDTAARLIHERGYAATGVAEVLRESGAGSGSLYYFFPTKEDLLLGVLDRYGERLEEEIVGPAFASTQDPVERIFRILGFYEQSLLATDFRLGCPIGNLAGELADSHPRVRDRLDALFGAWRGAVAQCLLEVQDRLPEGADPDRLALFVLTVMEGAVMQARVARSLVPFEASVATLRDYFERLLETAGGKHDAPQ